MAGPLAGLRVVDLTQILSGPYCTMMLADFGAEVIKVEPPGGDTARLWGPHPKEDDTNLTESSPTSDTYGGYFASVNRNKRSMVLDLKTKEGHQTLLSMLSQADVVVENFRVGVMDRLGLSYEILHDLYPRLVYGTIRGFGDPRTGESPYANWPAYDVIAQAMGGIMGITGADAQHPMKAGPGVGDIFPAVLAAFGILAAVRHAEATGEGQFVDVAMYDAVVAMCERMVYQHSITGSSPSPQGNTHPLLCPYGVVRTATGFITVAAPSDHHWQTLTELLGRPDLGSDPRFVTNQDRLANAESVYQVIEEWTSGLSTDEVIAQLGGRIPCGPVNTAADIAKDPHTKARQLIVTVDHPNGSTLDIVGTPIKLSATPASDFMRAPLLGEHTEEVLSALLNPGGDTEQSDSPATPTLGSNQFLLKSTKERKWLQK